MATEPQPTGNKPATSPAVLGVDDDPAVRAARRDLELAKVAAERERLGLTDQAERAKLLQGLVPDLEKATVKEDTVTASDTPSSLSESLIQRAIHAVVDDVADLTVGVVKRIAAAQNGGPTNGWTFLVTSDAAFLDNAAARRDVLLRLQRVQDAIASECAPKEAVVLRPQTGRYLQFISAPATASAGLSLFSPAAAVLGALPGAISLATRLFSHQYTTSAYTSTGNGCVDIHAAGMLMARAQQSAGSRVLVSRLQPASDADLEARVLELAQDVDGCLSEALIAAEEVAAQAAHRVEMLSARRTRLEARATAVETAWTGKVGKSATAAGLTEDIAVAKALEATIAESDDKEAKKQLEQVLTAVRARIAAVLRSIAEGSGELGAGDLLALLHGLDVDVRHAALDEKDAKDDQTRADSRVTKLTALRTNALDLLESLATTDASGTRLMDKACRGAALMHPGTLVLYIRLHHGGADGLDDVKVGADLRITTYGATVEWALLDHNGTLHDSGARTVIGYTRRNLKAPDRSISDLIGYQPVQRATLP